MVPFFSNFSRVSQKGLVNDMEILYFLDQEQSRRAPEQTKVQRRSTTCRYKSHTCVLTGYPFAEHRFVIFETLFVQIPFPFSNYSFLYAGKVIFIFKEELSEKRSHSKGQLISKCLFWCLHFLPKNERKNKLTSSKVEFVRSFLEVKSAWKNHDL